MDIRQNNSDTITIGRIINIDRKRNSFTVTDRGMSSAIRFNAAPNIRVFDILVRPMDFSGLRVGMRVQVRHASFMTNSIPPQTTAFVVRVIR